MVNVILDAKTQSFKLCAVDGVDVVRHFPLLDILASISDSLNTHQQQLAWIVWSIGEISINLIFF